MTRSSADPSTNDVEPFGVASSRDVSLSCRGKYLLKDAKTRECEDDQTGVVVCTFTYRQN